MKTQSDTLKVALEWEHLLFRKGNKGKQATG
jgi:hypothetical protein